MASGAKTYVTIDSVRKTTNLRKGPMNLFDETALGCFTARQWLLFGNGVAALVHLALMFVVIGFTIDKPVYYPAYLHSVRVPENKTLEMLRNELNGAWDPTSLEVFLSQEEEDIVQIPIHSLTIAFFALSGAAHLFYALSIQCPFLNCRMGDYSLTYLELIHGCQNPLRWIEYFFSASIMGFILAYLCGIRIYAMLWLIAGLIATTMVFGHFTEFIAGVKEGKANREWTRPVYVRISPWIVGWIPFVAAVINIGSSFGTVSKFVEMPDFVPGIVIAELVLFTSFGFVQLAQQCMEPDNYWYGELAYIVLSLVAKVALGITLTANIFT